MNTVTINILNSYLDSNKNEWCEDGINAFKKLIELYKNGINTVNVNSTDYAIYGGKEPCYDNLNKIIVIDWNAFEKHVISFCDDWCVPIEGKLCADIYLL